MSAGRTTPTPSRHGAGIAVPLCLLLIAGLTFVFRVVPPWQRVFPTAGEVRLFDTDSYMHLRHARAVTKHFPHLQRWDVALYPDGERMPHAGLFDLTIAAAAMGIGLGAPTDLLVEQVAAWTPPVLAVLATLVVYCIGRRAAAPGVGLLACAILLLYPGSFLNRTLLGFADHHAAEVLLLLLATEGVMRCVGNSQAERVPPWWRPAVVDALPLAACIFTWRGAPIYLLLVAAALFTLATIRVASGRGCAALATASFRYGAGLLVLLAPLALLYPDLVMDVDVFPEVLAGCAALAFGLPVYLHAARFITHRVGRPPLIAAGGLLLAGAAVAATIRFVPSGHWLLDQLLDPKTTLVREHAEVTWPVYWYYAGVPGLLAPIAVPIALSAAWMRGGRATIPVALGAMLIALWWRTRDYGYAAPPFIALMAALVLGALAHALGRRRIVRSLVALGAAGALVVPHWPLRSVNPAWPPQSLLPRLMIINEGWVQALRWMATHTPEPTLPLDARVPAWTNKFHFPAGTYGVLAFWEFGHFIAAIGQRPPVASSGISPATARWFLMTDEEASVRELCPQCESGERVRYVVLDARSLGDFFAAETQVAGRSSAEYTEHLATYTVGGRSIELSTYGEMYRRSMAARLYLDDGSELSRYRLVYASPHRSLLAYIASPVGAGQGGALGFLRQAFPIDSPDTERRYDELVSRRAVISGSNIVYEGQITATVKVFEQVAGAHLVGDAPPGAAIEARLNLQPPGGEPLVYRRTATADAAGRYEIVVAHATYGTEQATAVQSVGAYEIGLVGSGPLATVSVSEQEVQAGGRIDLGRSLVDPPS